MARIGVTGGSDSSMNAIQSQSVATKPGGPAIATDWRAPAADKPRTQRKRASGATRFRRDWVMLALVLPGLLYFTIFYYIEALGYVIAFQNYLPFLGFFASPFVGLQNFRDMISDAAFWQAVRNTLTISLIELVLYFPAPIGLAMLLEQHHQHESTQTHSEHRVLAVLHLMGHHRLPLPANTGRCRGCRAPLSGRLAFRLSTSSAARHCSNGW